MRIRRCSALLIQPRERVEFDLGSLLDGGDGLESHLEWIALAPHLGEEVPLEAADVLLLGGIGETTWVEYAPLSATYGAERVDALLGKGLLIGDGSEHAMLRARDEHQRAAHWHPISAVSHAFGRWRDVDSSDALTQTGLRTVGDLVNKLGPPPPHFHACSVAGARVPLPAPAATPLGELMNRRTTCRNFDRSRSLPAADFADLMHRVFAAQAAFEAAPGASVLKKTSPSGGGLHATEAYVLVQGVDGIAPGLYHYHAGEHALQPLPLAAPGAPSRPVDRLRAGQPPPIEGEGADIDALHALAQRCVAGQYWFADAQVLVMLTPRFARSFWKYRNHAKAYRALILDAGHLSQTLYLTATELGLGAFVTSAINEVEIERAFGLDPLEESPLAVCGFGWRAAEKVTVEFDPLHKVWAA